MKLILQISAGYLLGASVMQISDIAIARMMANMAQAELTKQMSIQKEEVRKQDALAQAKSKHMNIERPLKEGEQCIAGSIVKVDYNQHSAIQVLENQQPTLCR
jgi:hypothetical protein